MNWFTGKMIFTSFVWISIVAGGSSVGANEWNKLVDDNINSILADIVKDGETKVNEHYHQNIFNLQNVNLTKFNPPAKLLRTLGDQVALTLLCGPYFVGNLSTMKREGDPKLELEPLRIETYMATYDLYARFSKCHLLWNGKSIFSGSVKITFLGKIPLKVIHKFYGVRKKCRVRFNMIYSNFKSFEKFDVHAYNEDGTTDKMSSYLINNAFGTDDDDDPGRWTTMLGDQAIEELNDIMRERRDKAEEKLCPPLTKHA